MRFETYKTRLDAVVTSGEYAGAWLSGGDAFISVNDVDNPELFIDGEPPDIISHEALVRITGCIGLTKVWADRTFTAQQIKEIRYYRKGGPCDGHSETQTFKIENL